MRLFYSLSLSLAILFASCGAGDGHIHTHDTGAPTVEHRYDETEVICDTYGGTYYFELAPNSEVFIDYDSFRVNQFHGNSLVFQQDVYFFDPVDCY